MALFTAGNVLTAAQLNALNSYKEKVADQSVTNSTVLVNDLHLSYAIPVVGTYIFDLFLYGVSAANAAGGFRYGFTFPTGTLHYGINVPISTLPSGTSGSGDWAGLLSQASGVAGGIGGLSTNATQHHIHGRFAATATGTLQFQWAQAAANAAASTLKTGSHMLVRQVA
jgi:hypothetical protein